MLGFGIGTYLALGGAGIGIGLGTPLGDWILESGIWDAFGFLDD
jgi:hypothetical protein